MEIIDRIENPLLSRVELKFKWNHHGISTPSRKDMLNQLASIEPGANRDFIVIKDVMTRYGVATTTGIGLIYESQEAMSVEPEYVHKRLAGVKNPSSKAKSSKAKPVVKQEVSGGEE